jgi:hypothetical protein
MNMVKICENCEHFAESESEEPCVSCTSTSSNWTQAKELPFYKLSDFSVGPQVSLDSHYKFSFNGVKMDPYRIMDVYGISHPAQQHAIKKLLRAGKSVKSLRQDVEEVQMTLIRWLEMMDESDGR